MSNIKTTQVEFTGKASEYFGIWIVNLLLTILTFGIYSAWAKVRRKKYFYNNTLIENVGFDYHAKPIAILKGRIIAFLFFIGYAFGGKIHPLISAFFVILFFLGLPWLVVRSSLFNARNTSHRGLRFDFVGKVGEAARIFILLPIVTVLTLWLAFPYVSHQKNKFLMSNHKFGLSQFDMQAKVSSFYKVYLIVFIVPIIGILAAVAIPAYQQYTKKAAEHAGISVPYAVGFVSIAPNEKVVLAANEKEQDVYRVERVYSDNAPTTAEVAAGEIIPEVEGVVELEAEVQAAMDAPSEKTLDEMIEESMTKREKAREEGIRDMLLNPGKMLFAIFGMLAYALLIFGFAGYIKARIGNLVWNATTLDDLSFKSSLRARDYIWLYFTNIVAIVITFGLATPWAQVRLARYRASKLQIVGDVDFDKFVGEKKDAVKATGEEIADFFDADFSFG
jgi:uncharacterized membrane protein YjgN (DUF898 family)